MIKTTFAVSNPHIQYIFHSAMESRVGLLTCSESPLLCVLAWSLHASSSMIGVGAHNSAVSGTHALQVTVLDLAEAEVRACPRASATLTEGDIKGLYASRPPAGGWLAVVADLLLPLRVGRSSDICPASPFSATIAEAKLDGSRLLRVATADGAVLVSVELRTESARRTAENVPTLVSAVRTLSAQESAAAAEAVRATAALARAKAEASAAAVAASDASNAAAGREAAVIVRAAALLSRKKTLLADIASEADAARAAVARERERADQAELAASRIGTFSLKKELDRGITRLPAAAAHASVVTAESEAEDNGMVALAAHEGFVGAHVLDRQNTSHGRSHGKRARVETRESASAGRARVANAENARDGLAVDAAHVRATVSAMPAAIVSSAAATVPRLFSARSNSRLSVFDDDEDAVEHSTECTSACDGGVRDIGGVERQISSTRRRTASKNDDSDDDECGCDRYNAAAASQRAAEKASDAAVGAALVSAVSSFDDFGVYRAPREPPTVRLPEKPLPSDDPFAADDF